MCDFLPYDAFEDRTSDLVGVSENLEGVTLTGFEGPEKKIEIDFCPIPGVDTNPSGMCVFSNKTWQTVLDAAKCTILSSMCTKEFTSYVLSESSLFVYPHKVMLKTCGTTRLLLVIPHVMELAKKVGLRLEFFCFSRRNFLFPSEQPAPHTSFPDEVAYLNTLFTGEAYTLGPISHDHWLLYIADFTERAEAHLEDRDVTLEIMMLDLDIEVMKNFYAGSLTGTEVTNKMGFNDLLKDSIVIEHLFEPCGYSCNAHSKGSYFTIHITPEPHCSYVSFETNAILPDYNELVEKVVSTLKPGRFSVTLFADNAALGEMQVPLVTEIPGFKRAHKTQAEFEGHYTVRMGNYKKV